MTRIVVLIFIYLSCNLSTLPLQVVNKKSSNQQKIVHVNTINSKSDIYKKSFLDQIEDLLFGENELKFSKPFSIITNNAKKIIVLDQGINDIVVIDQTENDFYTLNSRFNFPSLVDICKVDSNIFLFTDSNNNMIYMLNLASNNITPLKINFDLNKPTGIGYCKSKNEIWICDTGTHSIIVLGLNGKIKKRIGRRGNGELEFNFPTSIWIDQADKIFVVDALNYRVQILDKNGNFLSCFGTQGDATGYFARPKGIATDNLGNIYIVDGLFHAVQVFNRSGEYLYNFGNQGTGNNEFWMPTGIDIDADNNIYIADSYNSRIQIFKLEGF